MGRVGVGLTRLTALSHFRRHRLGEMLHGSDAVINVRGAEVEGELLYADFGAGFHVLYDLACGGDERAVGGVGRPFIESYVDEVQGALEGDRDFVEDRVPISPLNSRR